MAFFTTGLVRAFNSLMIIANLQTLECLPHFANVLNHTPPTPPKKGKVSFMHRISLKSRLPENMFSLIKCIQAHTKRTHKNFKIKSQEHKEINESSHFLR